MLALTGGSRLIAAAAVFILLLVALKGEPAAVASGIESTTAAQVITAVAAPTIQGDVDCDNDVDPVDGLRILRWNAALSVFQNEPCTDIGVSTGSYVVGDVDCSGTINAVDALKVLRQTIALAVTQTEPCQDIGI